MVKAAVKGRNPKVMREISFANQACLARSANCFYSLKRRNPLSLILPHDTSSELDSDVVRRQRAGRVGQIMRKDGERSENDR